MKPLSTLMQLYTLRYVDTQNGVYFHIFIHNRCSSFHMKSLSDSCCQHHLTIISVLTHI